MLVQFTVLVNPVAECLNLKHLSTSFPVRVKLQVLVGSLSFQTWNFCCKRGKSEVAKNLYCFLPRYNMEFTGVQRPSNVFRRIASAFGPQKLPRHHHHRGAGRKYSATCSPGLYVSLRPRSVVKGGKKMAFLVSFDHTLVRTLCHSCPARRGLLRFVSLA